MTASNEPRSRGAAQLAALTLGLGLGLAVALLAAGARAQDTPGRDDPAAQPEPAQAAPEAAQAAPEAGPDADHPGDALHAPFDALLRAHVRDGRVDYEALGKRRDALQSYLDALARVDLAALDGPAAKALWINAYNAATLALILERLPGLGSIKDIPSNQRWKAVRWTVGGRKVSLDAMEHEWLRPMGDARIHFAIVCASRGCPDLAGKAYLPGRLDAQLDAAARRFLADPFKGLDTGDDEGFFGTDHELRLSPIFKWFQADFVRDAGSVVDYVLRYAEPADVAYLREHRDDLDVEWLDYDWSLNGR